ncbi:MAG: hypothetical protein IKM04_02555 [Clostridia bacterium]|nr:hypothetical protein [Clostridia bacterium]
MKLSKLMGVILLASISIGTLAACGGERVKTESPILEQKLIEGLPVSAQDNPVFDRSISFDVSQNALPSVQTGYSGEEFEIKRDANHGGGQFILKLFTEGLSRAAYGEEFAYFRDYVYQNGLSVETCAHLAKLVFTSPLFESFALSNNERSFALYRALLSRDPVGEELGSVTEKNISKKIDAITASEEFASLMEGMTFGPYFWGRNNTDAYTGTKLITAEQFRTLLAQNTETKTVVLEQGTLVLVDSCIAIPDGYTVKTEGDPDHYTKFARFLRVGEAEGHILLVTGDVSLQNIFVDGNRSGTKVGLGWNIAIIGNNTTVWGCRTSDSASNVHLISEPYTSDVYYGRNLITCYATNHDEAWADGLDMYASNGIMEYNHVVDATDGGIVLFRNTEATQNSIIRYNLVCNVGNSAYAGIDFESVDTDGGLADFRGAIAYGNEFYTGYTAHMHLAVTLSSYPWSSLFNAIEGHSFVNNYTPEGTFVNTGGGIVVNNVMSARVGGNQFRFFIGDWTACESGPRLYSVSPLTCFFTDCQSGYSRESAEGFIAVGREIERQESYTVREGFVYEDFVAVTEE